ncbi:FtsK/SpoIIIE family DNA translocase [Pelagibacterium luteolum]|uniref:DNA translocase FtsK n=1 Tax=Pelagibacterium luteolum TaxID=440168 RepID=A0A1G7SGF2_9HYPH|nr:DNA translocase FtsK [Pelagibacterium luteolum]SDG22146.1 DNA segregation ATPase FtsK/SpoIIIE, S-DNA-T family [Pelagibacterium luteolum]
MTLHSTSHLDDGHRSTPVLSITIPVRLIGIAIAAFCAMVLVSLASWSVDDPSFSYATDKAAENWLGFFGAAMADIGFQLLGLAAPLALLPPLVWSWSLIRRTVPSYLGIRLTGWVLGTALATGLFSSFPTPESWPLPLGLGGFIGTGFSGLYTMVLGTAPEGWQAIAYAAVIGIPALFSLWLSARTRPAFESEPKLPVKAKAARSTGRRASQPEPEPELDDEPDSPGLWDMTLGYAAHTAYGARAALKRVFTRRKQEEPIRTFRPSDFEPQLDRSIALDRAPDIRSEPPVEDDWNDYQPDDYDDDSYDVAPAPRRQQGTDDIARLIGDDLPGSRARVTAPAPRPQPSPRQQREAQATFLPTDGFELPPLELLAMPSANQSSPEHHPEALEANAKRLEGVLEDFGVKGDIINVRPGPVVTLYELEPAPGIKSSRVISLADDIARSMSAISARVAVVPGRNAIGIELPNKTRETVFLRELLASTDFDKAKSKLPICLGKTIGGEPIIVDLARMPHLLIAGTTGSGKSVGINTMILSLLYKMSPEQCRLIMIDPKMLELSVYDGIPHLLTPVVTDPAKAVVALKWAVREMEDRYKKMSKIGVRNIDGFNQRVAEASAKGEVITRTVQTGFDRETGEAIFESEQFDLEPLPFIVVIVDEMADLMMVAGKDIEGTIQRLAQMARAAGIHIIMATQRPSVDVITGTIKANFPTRVSFQVTSKIDSRTILGEQGAEQLLGNGDMLYMAGGGRIKRLHGAFVADNEVEDIVAHLKSQGSPEYLESITADEDDGQMGGLDDDGGFGGSGDELYDKAVNIVLADKKASTSYIQRRLSVGYNKAATLIERMEQEGIISPANHAGKREVLIGDNADGY